MGATEPGVRSVRGPVGSGSCTKHVFVVGLETGVPWTGGEGHGEPRGDTVEGGKPEKESNTDSMLFSLYIIYSYYYLSISSISLSLI